ncbi:hypothetical protein CERZMDRAFT_38242 [Cercospora zeae-maydis SCOH1-5]|uniref:N-acetylglucosamine-induced protein 1 n=1 Tax=Cercospora zeae-maydis SCOH1-5 TaxID=717836 RepID=A0A6A6FL75_9PEZI|nr:hypothetical protein CERZMDRAFT_38242 [Cercospora zeae-maydis SCOH1-5]
MGEPSQELSPDDIDLNDPPFPLTTIDREILATKDEDYHRTTWEDLKNIIATNTLEQLKRLPSDLRRYLAWSHNITRSHGSITSYVIHERLHWEPITSNPPTFSHYSAIPFSDPRDYVVLRNDWPYGLAPGIAHLLVWSKTPIATDQERGDVTEASREVIEEFVERYFVGELMIDGSDESREAARGRALWFKNWVSLQSVRGVDHVHVLVRDAPEAALEKWTRRYDL